MTFKKLTQNRYKVIGTIIGIMAIQLLFVWIPYDVLTRWISDQNMGMIYFASDLNLTQCMALLTVMYIVPSAKFLGIRSIHVTMGIFFLFIFMGTIIQDIMWMMNKEGIGNTRIIVAFTASTIPTFIVIILFRNLVISQNEYGQLKNLEKQHEKVSKQLGKLNPEINTDLFKDSGKFLSNAIRYIHMANDPDDPDRDENIRLGLNELLQLSDEGMKIRKRMEQITTSKIIDDAKQQ